MIDPQIVFSCKLILKVVFLFCLIFWSIVNTARTFYKQDIPVGNMICHSISLTGFIVLQWLL